MKQYSNVVTRYDDMIYDSRPVKFDEFITDKYIKIHTELYNDALDKYYNNVMSNLFSNEFIYEFFKLMTNNSDSFETFYQAYINLSNDNILVLTLNEISNKKYELLYELYNQTINALEKIHNEINNIINDITLKFGNDATDLINVLNSIHDFRVTYSINNTYLGLEDDEQNVNHEFLTCTFNLNENETPVFIEKRMLMSEIDNESYVFIFESDGNETRIGFTRDGEWILIIDENDENILNTNEEYYNYILLLVNYIDYINKQLIENYFKKLSLDNYKKTHRIIEIKNDEYWQPSTIIDIKTTYPYKKSIISLEKYWNMTQGFRDIDIYDVKNTLENIKDAELINLDYIKGIAKIRSRTNDIEFNVPFKYLDENINVSDEMTLNDTFGYKYKNQ